MDVEWLYRLLGQLLLVSQLLLEVHVLLECRENDCFRHLLAQRDTFMTVKRKMTAEKASVPETLNSFKFEHIIMD